MGLKLVSKEQRTPEEPWPASSFSRLRGLGHRNCWGTGDILGDEYSATRTRACWTQRTWEGDPCPKSPLLALPQDGPANSIHQAVTFPSPGELPGQHQTITPWLARLQNSTEASRAGGSLGPYPALLLYVHPPCVTVSPIKNNSKKEITLFLLLLLPCSSPWKKENFLDYVAPMCLLPHLSNHVSPTFACTITGTVALAKLHG